jgi:hypothetical protein
MVSYFAYNSFVQQTKLVLTEYDDPDPARTGPLVVNFEYIPRRYEAPARNWRTAHYASAWAFLGVYAIGVLDSVLRHRDEVITTTIEEPPAPVPGAPAAAPGAPAPSKPPAPLKLGVVPYFAPLPGGAGGGVSVTF